MKVSLFAVWFCGVYWYFEVPVCFTILMLWHHASSRVRCLIYAKLLAPSTNSGRYHLSMSDTFEKESLLAGALLPLEINNAVWYLFVAPWWNSSLVRYDKMPAGLFYGARKGLQVILQWPAWDTRYNFWKTRTSKSVPTIITNNVNSTNSYAIFLCEWLWDKKIWKIHMKRI